MDAATELYLRQRCELAADTLRHSCSTLADDVAATYIALRAEATSVEIYPSMLVDRALGICMLNARLQTYQDALRELAADKEVPS